MICIKRVYEKKGRDDGCRVLADRLWPRGLSKKEAAIDLWLKEIAPSKSLRVWFSHDLQKWEGFRKRYMGELEKKKNLVKKLKELEGEHKTVFLLFWAKDKKHNNAVVLRDYLTSIGK
ncbi:MAG: DUF488 domain-containing protein [Actinomycetota bacterium]